MNTVPYSKLQIVNYNDSEFSFDDKDETIWATQEQIVKLFESSKSNISEHISNILKNEELEEEVVRKFRITAIDGKKYNVTHYNLDMIIAVGYRVNSKKATEFRKWATGVLRQFIKDGYVIDHKRLKEDPGKLTKLAAEIRELRANEKNIYHSVRECFKLSASDYNPKSQEVKTFYALLQDKFHHAITKMTSSKLIMDRANYTKSSMGLQTVEGQFPTLKEAQTGKNYLTYNEMYRMHLLSEQFLLFAESTAMSGKEMTMKLLVDQLDNLLRLNNYPVFEGYEDYLKDRAMEHAKIEFSSWEKLQKLKLSGIDIDLIAFENGYYDEQSNALSGIPLHKLQKQFEEKQIKNIKN